jgi:hypothetical protein
VKLLGIDIDYQLNFDAHISTICRKASQQLNILKRLGSYLNRLNKLTIFRASLLIILYVSKAMVLILLICKEGTLAFCSNSS